LNPFRREITFRTDVAYGFGTLHWTPSPKLQLEPSLIAINMNDPAVAEARQVKAIGDFLYWARLPFARVDHRPEVTIVTIGDARYSRGAAAGRFVRTLRLPPRRPSQSQSAEDGPHAKDEHAPEDR
jgi:inner membrane protein